MRHITYAIKNGIKYAVVSSSETVDGKVVSSKKNLGRVIDEEKNIFHSRERGYFSYDALTDTYTELDESSFPPMRRKKCCENLVLDFGDAWFVDELIRSSHLDEAINSVGLNNMDSVKAIAMYYILSGMDNSSAASWWEGSYARILYPDADLSEEMLNDILEGIGNEINSFRFFVKYVMNSVRRKDYRRAVMMESSGLPDSRRFHLSAVKKSDESLSGRGRMIYAVSEDTGLPLYVQYYQENAAGVLGFEYTAASLYGLGTGSVVAVPSDLCHSEKTVMEYYEEEIPFLMQLSPDADLFKKIENQCLQELGKKENAVIFNNRFICLLRKKVLITSDGSSRILEDDETPSPGEGSTAYAYLGRDVIEDALERNLACTNFTRMGLPVAMLKDILDRCGVFVLLSSSPMKEKRALSCYYMSHRCIDDFDLGCGKNLLSPYVSRSENALNGHLKLTFIAAVIKKMMNEKLEKAGISLDEALTILRNHKCRVTDGVVVPEEKTKKEEKILRLFKFKMPSDI